jgi:hypothetical protein
MKRFIISLIIIVAGSVQSIGASIKTYGITPVNKIPNNKNVEQQTVMELVQFLQPNSTDKVANEIARSVLKNSRSINIDWRLFVSILFQESSLTLDPQNCYMDELHPSIARIKNKVGYKIVQKSPKKCIDYGIAQINWRTWGKALSLNKELLVTDIDYSIGAATKILSYYKKTYAKKDTRWHLRYHSNTPEFKEEYGNYIHKKFKRIQKFETEKKGK